MQITRNGIVDVNQSFKVCHMEWFSLVSDTVHISRPVTQSYWNIAHITRIQRLSLLHWILPYLTSSSIDTLSASHPFLNQLITNWTIMNVFHTSSMHQSSSTFHSFFTHLRFIGEGGYKVVFQTQTPKGEEALSVMNLSLLRRKRIFFWIHSFKELDVVAKQDLYCSLLLSLLVTHQVLPLYTQLFGAFTTLFPPPILSSAPPSDEYLYLRMEYNNCGDLETYLKHGSEINSQLILSFFFQMVLSLYVANRVVIDNHGNWHIVWGGSLWCETVEFLSNQESRKEFDISVSMGRLWASLLQWNELDCKTRRFWDYRNWDRG